MKYDHKAIEQKWQQYWAKNGTFEAKSNPPSGEYRGKYYVLDMFPYPSGAGLHVGHPLGYIASDIYARYKRHKGFNVLHPQGYDSFGLPAEQYAIQTGQHPAITTETNIKRYREQLDKIGFSFDWSREVRTSDPEYYKWTQWIFIQLFESWYNNETDKAEGIDTLVAKFEADGNQRVNAACDEDAESFSAEDWKNFSEKEQQQILLKYRLTYLAETEVNWCAALGTVLANDEVVNGVSERGGHPVVRKKMTQWSMRISAYAQRLLDGLKDIDWPQPLKDSQTNWIGRSKGAKVEFRIQNSEFRIGVFTTRPDTIFGVTFMTLAPELDLVKEITTPEQKAEVDAYIDATAKRSERERMADVKSISGAFTGAYAEHPFTKEPIPIWIGDYVLAGYGTGAVMAVPCGDQRDYDFAKHFDIPIKNIFGGVDISEQAYAEKDKTPLKDSDFLNGLSYKQALPKAIEALEEMGAGKGKINYRLRDAVFSRQRYWGEPFPVYYVDGMPQMIDAEHLPLRLPEVEKYLPTEEGEPPLGRAEKWHWDTNKNEVVFPPTPEGGASGVKSERHSELDSESHTGIYPLELNTMPGWAGSSWYFFRYMEKAQRDEVFASKEAMDYWQNVDLYIGGSEHATGHLLYSRFWVKFLHDRNLVPVEEPFKKLINQGMILGESAFVYRVEWFYIGANWGELSENEESQIPLKSDFPDLYVSKAWFDDMGRHIKNYKKSNLESVNIISSKIEELEGELDIFSKPGKTNISRSYTLAITPVHVDVSLVNTSDQLDIEAFKKWRPEFKNAILIGENGEEINNNNNSNNNKYIVGREVEKMSKSKYNVVNPDDICEDYGADTLRMYEMFLGPLEQAKPWNTAGISGVYNFLKKFWKLFHEVDKEGNILGFQVNEAPQSPQPPKGEQKVDVEGLKILHKTIKKVEDDIENFSFNTTVSTFMIAVNELTSIKCNSREVLEPLTVLLSPYAPHICEELWEKLGHSGSISAVPFPVYEEKYTKETSKEYPISFNGKMRFTMELSLDLSKEEIEKAVMANEKTQEQLAGRTPKKVIVVPGKIVNLVG